MSLANERRLKDMAFASAMSEPNRRRAAIDVVKAFIALTKPKIAVFIVFTAYCAMVAAYGRIPALSVTLATLGGLALSSAGGAAINMWFDRDIDQLMHRTSNRPLPVGLVRPMHAFLFGVFLAIMSFIVLDVWVNLLSALLSIAGCIYYAVIYTMWLKRRTPQNIVIGGGAGAFPPLVGWAAMTNHVGIAAWLMFAMIFLWTPPHFWGLALYKNDDYVRANVPMMPVVRGPRVTRWQMVLYTIAMIVASVALVPYVHHHWLYALAALFVGCLFLVPNVILLFRPLDETTWAKRTFLSSLAYLPVAFGAIILASL